MPAATQSPSLNRPTSGPTLFARYAYPPNRLGLCGPDDAPALRDGAIERADDELRHLATRFEGAFPYLELIARENGLADPLDRRVVEGYWLGNELTARVRTPALARSLHERFAGRMGRRSWEWLERSVGGGSRPIHAFHVMEIFPRAGLMRGGGDDLPLLATMDACRIRWGTLVSITGDELVVSAPHLELAAGKLRIGPPRLDTVTGWWDADGPLGGIQIGEPVSLHWGWACDRLRPAQLRRLTRWTESAIAIANQTI
jgi:hypothetical protein